MDPSERLPIWSTDDVARRRQEVLCTLVDDNHPLYVDARELFTPPLSREEVTQLLLTALETYCEIRAVARELRYLDPIVKNDTKGRQKRHPRLHAVRKHLQARLEFLENEADRTLPFTFYRPNAGRRFAAGEGLTMDLIDPVPDSVVATIFTPVFDSQNQVG